MTSNILFAIVGIFVVVDLVSDIVDNRKNRKAAAEAAAATTPSQKQEP